MSGPSRLHALAGVLLALLLLGSAGGSVADQSDPRLDELFDRLANAPSARLAATVEQEIWHIWFAHDVAAAQALLQRARERAQAGDAAAANGLFDELVTTYPDFAEGWNQRAILRYLQGDLDGSLADIARTLALEPRHFGALSGRGQCLLRLERYADAAATFEDALALNPWLDSVRMQLEMIAPLLNDPPRAI
ncbi:MAG: tetratricopeptide repeat protein [Gammaproteobacteria bacterium]